MADEPDDVVPTIVAAEWYDCTSVTYTCDHDCHGENEDCGHDIEQPEGRQIEFSYSDGTTGHLVPMDIDDFGLEPCAQ